MRSIVADRVTWSVGLSVGRSVTLVSPAKTAEPIEMLFGLRTRGAQGTTYYMGIHMPSWEAEIWRGKRGVPL